MVLYYIIGLACVTVLWINSEPTIRFRNRFLKNDSYIKRMSECALCSGFWIYLLFMIINSQSFLIGYVIEASITSIIAELINRRLNKINI